MIEEVERKYVQGMDNVLGLTGESSDSSKNRFINLIAIKRESGSNISKRCVGAINSVDFGQTLTQVNPKFCSENTELKSRPSGENSNISSLFQNIRNGLNGLNSEQLQKIQTTLNYSTKKDVDKRKLLTNLLAEVKLSLPGAVFGENSSISTTNFLKAEAEAEAEADAHAIKQSLRGGARKLTKRNRKILNKKENYLKEIENISKKVVKKKEKQNNQHQHKQNNQQQHQQHQ